MPEIRYYEVEQTRTVKVAANNEESALRIANDAFDGNSEKAIDDWGHALGDVSITDVHIKRECV
jgi:hypothetical protein